MQHDLRKCFKLPLGEQLVLDSSIGIVDRRGLSRASLHDQANLLLSIANIAHSEILQCPSALSDNDDDQERHVSSFPSFPKSLEGDDDWTKELSQKTSVLIPRTESLRRAISMGFPSVSAATRLRSVSFDSPSPKIALVQDHSPLPLPPAPLLPEVEDLMLKRGVHKKATHKHYKRGTLSKHVGRKKSRLSESPRKTDGPTKIPKPAVVSPRTSLSMVKDDLESLSMEPPLLPSSKSVLQSPPAPGVTIKKIFRRKFSWKNYPEVRARCSIMFLVIEINLHNCFLCTQLEAFLVLNREEYLRHSALNYTLQQKHYNNQLTMELLTLATKYGYMFDETDFNFVTVRDRIRCYYKSFVQSAKKRGVLMGYAAKKAGLLTDHDLLGGCGPGDDQSTSSDSIAMDLTMN